ncbi:MAG TPA: TadE/TadG family type IV pilus assembly protein [Terracidiphilus sp.]
MTRPRPLTMLRGRFRAPKGVTQWWAKTPLRSESGSELLEFGICSTLFFTLVFGFLEICMALFMANSVAEASRQAARWASVRGTTSGVTVSGTTSCINPNMTVCPAQSGDIQTFAQSQPGMSSSSSVTTVTVNWCNADGSSCSSSQSNATPGHVVKVKVSYKFAKLPFVSNTAITLSSTAEKIIWQ